jgi:hypothetical protein
VSVVDRRAPPRRRRARSRPHVLAATLATAVGGDDSSWWAFSCDGADGGLAFSRRARPPAAGDVARTLAADAIYGAFRLLSGEYLAVVSKSRRIAHGPYGAVIHQIEEMKWLPVRRRAVAALAPGEREEEEGCVGGAGSRRRRARRRAPRARRRPPLPPAAARRRPRAGT